MRVALFGASGRTDAAHAALILVDALLVNEGAARLVRVTLPGETALPEPTYKLDGLTIVQHETGRVEDIVAIAAAEAAASSRRGTVLDLPASCLAEGVLDRISVPVVVAGPTPFDEHAADLLLRAFRDRTGIDLGVTGSPWLLGCGRGGLSAARAFASTMRGLASAGHGDRAPRVLPVVLPPLCRREAAAVVEGDRTARTLAAGPRLLTALKVARGNADASAVTAEALADALGADVGLLKETDERNVGDRLRELADELQAIRDHAAPTDDDLAAAPRIEDWKAGAREIRILTGRAYGHPDIADGRRISTSDLYASDGKTWARTLSRYYRLGKPAKGQAGNGLR